MQASADSLAFAPPPEPAAIRAFVLAFVAHLLLLIALAWGVNWQKEPTIAAEAELWASIPEQAAPPPPVPAPQPAPPPVVEKTTPPPVTKEPDIVQEREKKRLEEEARRQREEEERKALEAKKKQQQEEAAKREQAEKLKKEELAKKEKAKQELEAKQREALRQETVRNMLAQAGKASVDSQGSAAKSAGPSATWGARINARVRPNIQVPGDVAGNPRAEVEVKLAPDGTIVGAKLVKSSGNPAWDRAVLNALDLTGSLPRDIDGTVHSPVTLGFSRHN